MNHTATNKMTTLKLDPIVKDSESLVHIVDSEMAVTKHRLNSDR